MILPLAAACTKPQVPLWQQALSSPSSSAYYYCLFSTSGIIRISHIARIILYRIVWNTKKSVNKINNNISYQNEYDINQIIGY